MNTTKTPERGARILLIMASLVIVVAGLKAIKVIALPFLVALFLSILSAPLLKWLCKHRIPKLIAVLTTVLVNISVLATFLILVGNSVSALAGTFPSYKKNIEQRTEATFTWLEDHDIDTSTFEWLREILGERSLADPEAVAESPEAAASSKAGANLGGIIDLVGSMLKAILKGIAGILGMTFIVFVLMIFMLFEASGLPRKLQAAFGWRNETMVGFAGEIQSYLLIKTVISIITGCLIGGILWLINVEHFVLWGLLAFAFNYVPNIGSVLGSIFPVTLTVIDQGPTRAMLVILVFVAVNVSLGNFIEPHLMGRQFGISTLVVVLGLLFWGWLWGPVGMLLSVPLTMIVKIMLENTEDMRWVARLIGANPRPGLFRPVKVDGEG